MSLTQIAQRDSVISAWIPRRIFDRTLRGKSLTFKSVTRLNLPLQRASVRSWFREKYLFIYLSLQNVLIIWKICLSSCQIIDDYRVDITYRAIANIVDAIRYLSLRKCHCYILKTYLV